MAVEREQVEVVADAAALAERAARRIAEAALRTVQRQGCFRLALSGGRTPFAAYRLLAMLGLPWQRIVVGFSDERCVPGTHPDSNFAHARDALLDHVAIPAANVLPMPGWLPPPDGARVYERILHRPPFAPGSAFDLCLLGMGDDGHCASLFPNDRHALDERERWVVPGLSPLEPHLRLTLTYPALAACGEVLFLVTGAAKAATLARVWAGAAELPAARVRSAAGAPSWLIDAAAYPG